MAKKQTRRSISVSRNAYERLKAFCETSGVSMSQFVETGIHEKLDDAGAAPPPAGIPSPRPPAQPMRADLGGSVGGMRPLPPRSFATPSPAAPPPRREPVMTSAAARFAVEPPPPIIKRAPVEHEPKAPAEPTPGQIFTF